MERTVETRDDARAHRAKQSERIADDKRLVANAHGVRIPECGGHDVRRRLERTQDGDIILWLRGCHLRGRLGAIRERQVNRSGLRDDVQAREDVALSVNDNTASEILRYRPVRARGLRLDEDGDFDPEEGSYR